MRTHLTDLILWQSLAIFLLIVALLGILLGLLLIIRPQLMQAINHAANRWVSMRRMNKLIERSISIEYWIHRHHRPLGILIAFGAIYILMYFGLLFDRAPSLQRMTSYLPVQMADGLLDALVLAALTGGALALWAGLMLWLRPSLLRGIEEEANQWVTLRRTTKVLDVPRDQVDSFVLNHANKVGWLLLLGSIYLFFAMFRLLV
ncbi:MAG: hypothetical protein Q7J38_05440 [Gallionella sp.]|nr:hypothetical protein [Gallionella sp.]